MVACVAAAGSASSVAASELPVTGAQGSVKVSQICLQNFNRLPAGLKMPKSIQSGAGTGNANGIPVGARAGPQVDRTPEVDQLKLQLQRAFPTVENSDENKALDVLSRLEKLELTKEVLEATRIGAAVNELRKQTAQNWPNVSKRCRALIKAWQKVAEFHRPMSSCDGSSNGGTPNLVSPALRRGLTPRTPGGTVGKRITSTDSHSRVLEATQNGGSYAPGKGKSISPFTAVNSIHKSASVAQMGSLKCSPSSDEFSRDSLPSGADAASFAAEKRKFVSEDSMSAAMLKRSKSSGMRLASQQVTPPVSVVAARKNVQSTAELVAQLSENLPQSMAIDIIKPQTPAQTHTEVSLHRESKTYPYGLDTAAGTSKASPPLEFTAGRQKRKYTKRAAKFFKNAQAVPEAGDVKNGYAHPEPEDEHSRMTAPLDGIAEESEDDVDGPSSSVSLPESRASGFDWYSTIPSIESLKNQPVEHAKPRSDPISSCVIPIRQRQVLLLPYVDIGMPDFVEHNFPDQDKFLAKPSWLGAVSGSAKQQ
ncbi:TFIIS helical bundle-like domain-containing protein [Ditylenchus destructor]|nr:TFIIS helical bundle-like domain-containing protein [Ditylenchus destructor]